MKMQLCDLILVMNLNFYNNFKEMAFFISRKDPIRENINSVLSQWNYGVYVQEVSNQIYSFLTQYPQFELFADTFTYNNIKTTSKVAYLRGAMVLTIDYEEHDIPLHFVLINGFPSVAPKAFLSTENDETIIKENPFVLK